MKAWQYSSFSNGADALQLVTDSPVPAVTKGHILVKVKATSLNGLDWKLQEGVMRPFLPPKFPFIPGFDVAGEVVAVGPQSDPFQVGDAVFGGTAINSAGCFAEFVLVPVSQAAKLPPAVTPAQAVGLAIAGCAAIQSVRDFAGIPLPSPPASPVNALVANATGGVGILEVQLLKLAGVHVTATAGTRNLDFVKSLGADEVLDYKTPEGKALTSPSGKKYDLVFDNTLHMTWKELHPVLSPAGKWLFMSPSPASMASQLISYLFSKQHLVNVLSNLQSRDLETLAGLAAAGKLKVPVSSETPFSKLPEAWKLSKEGHGLGKIVVVMD